MAPWRVIRVAFYLNPEMWIHHPGILYTFLVHALLYFSFFFYAMGVFRSVNGYRFRLGECLSEKNVKYQDIRTGNLQMTYSLSAGVHLWVSSTE